ncbi:hypothetical protein SE91_11430 [Bradyrhizobium sp. DOA1]|nr:hypothetical protein SE91_11430 [Bradyrhizobium sp. DOA1]
MQARYEEALVAPLLFLLITAAAHARRARAAAATPRLRTVISGFCDLRASSASLTPAAPTGATSACRMLFHRVLFSRMLLGRAITIIVEERARTSAAAAVPSYGSSAGMCDGR